VWNACLRRTSRGMWCLRHAGALTLWRGAAGLCARVRARVCAGGAAESLAPQACVALRRRVCYLCEVALGCGFSLPLCGFVRKFFFDIHTYILHTKARRLECAGATHPSHYCHSAYALLVCRHIYLHILCYIHSPYDVHPKPNVTFIQFYYYASCTRSRPRLVISLVTR